MANTPIVEDPDMAPVIRAVSLFCAALNGAGMGQELAIVLKRARAYEDYIRTGEILKEKK